MPVVVRKEEAESARAEVTRRQAVERAVPLPRVTHVLDTHGCREQQAHKLAMTPVVITRGFVNADWPLSMFSFGPTYG